MPGPAMPGPRAAERRPVTKRPTPGARKRADPAPDAPPPTTDPGAVVADLHARAVVLREHVGWPSGEALAGMPIFRETVEAVLAKDLPDDALLRIGTDNDEFVASVGLAALVERDALPADWTDTAVRRLRRSGTQDEHFLLLTLVTVPGRVIGRVLEQNRHISDAGIAWFLEQRVAAGEPVDAETFSADVRADEADELDRIFDEEPDVPESVRTAFREWKDSLGEAELRRYLGTVGTVWQPPYNAPPASLVAGREEPVARIADALADIPPRSLVLVGEHGVGKTRAPARRARPARASCHSCSRRRRRASTPARCYIGQLEGRAQDLVKRLRRRSVVWVMPQPRTRPSTPGSTARARRACWMRCYRTSRTATSCMVGEVGPAEYEQLIAARPRVASAFDVVRVRPLGEAESVEVVRHALARRRAGAERLARARSRRRTSLPSSSCRASRAPGNTLRLVGAAGAEVARGGPSRDHERRRADARWRRPRAFRWRCSTPTHPLTLADVRALLRGARARPAARRSTALVERIAIVKAGPQRPDAPAGRASCSSARPARARPSSRRPSPSSCSARRSGSCALDMSEYQTPEQRSSGCWPTRTSIATARR